MGYGIDGMHKVQELQAISWIIVFPIPTVFFFLAP